MRSFTCLPPIQRLINKVDTVSEEEGRYATSEIISNNLLAPLMCNRLCGNKPRAFVRLWDGKKTGRRIELRKEIRCTITRDLVDPHAIIRESEISIREGAV